MRRFVADARYVWSLPLGRLAVACVAVGLVGLLTHYWAWGLTYVALPRDLEDHSSTARNA